MLSPYMPHLFTSATLLATALPLILTLDAKLTRQNGCLLLLLLLMLLSLLLSYL